MKTDFREHRERAANLAREIIILDGHIDVPHWLHNVFSEDISERTVGGDFDYPRAVEGGLDAAFMAIYVPPAMQKDGGAREYADLLIDLVERIIRNAPDKFSSAVSAAEIRANHARGLVSLPMGVENGAALEDDARNLEHFYDRGIRYLTLTHGKDNSICDSSYDDRRTWGGLSDFGTDVIAEMNRLGLIIDVSHASDDAFYEILEASDTPPVATHSSARAFTPDWERNLSDDMIRALADKGGAVMINFGSRFLRAQYIEPAQAAEKRIESEMKQRKLDRNTLEGFTYLSRRRADSTLGTADDAAAHVQHVAELVGVEHVGLGSDFDGVFTFPAGLEDVSGYPNLIAALLRIGFTETDISKICAENFLRLWEAVEASVPA